VFSDPSYGSDVWCQYRKDFSDKNWFMSLETKDGEYNSIDFSIKLGRPSFVDNFKLEAKGDELRMFYPQRYNLESVELGMDTACIFCGTKENFVNWGEEAAINTGTDGLFGDLYVFTVKGEAQPAGFFLNAFIDKTFITEKELFQELTACFEGKEISKEEFLAKTDSKTMENKMLIAEENHCAKVASIYEANHKDKSQNAPER